MRAATQRRPLALMLGERGAIITLMVLLGAAIVVPLASRLFYKFSQRLLVLKQPVKVVPALLLIPILLLSFTMAGRSTLGHRAVNPSTVALTTDHLVNDLALKN